METSLITTKEAKIQAVELVGGTLKAKSMKESVHTFSTVQWDIFIGLLMGVLVNIFPRSRLRECDHSYLRHIPNIV